MRIRILEDAEADRLAMASNGRLDARRFLAAYPPVSGDHLMLVTTRELAVDGCESVFGYADRRRGVAVVSGFRLSGDGEERLAARVTNVIAHERGHLEGLGHCRTEGCIMRPARGVRDVDARGLERCGRCLRPRRGWLARAAAAAACLLVFAGVQLSARLVKVKKPPFSSERSGVVLYRHRPVLTLRGEQEARFAAQSLNGLYAQLTPPQIEASPGGPGALLRAGNVTLAAIDHRSAGGGDPVRYAEDWAASMRWLMRAKGTEAEGCPDCHIRRLPEVQEAARIRRQRRW